MPYAYRKMNPEERATVVAWRHERGYPLHSPPHPFRQAGWYLITATNFEHARIMDTAVRREEFERALLTGFREIGVQIGGWVILANHYHILLGVATFDQISKTLKQLHGSTAHAWNKADRVQGRRRVWYKFADRLIRDERHFNRALNYIHANPVKHGYVGDSFEWPWSSLHFYAETNGHEWIRALEQHDPPGDFGKDWDAP